MNIKNRVRKVLGVVSASVMIVMMLGVVYANGQSYYRQRGIGRNIPIPIPHNGNGDFFLPAGPGVDKSKITYVDIDRRDGYTSIGTSAFENCKELTDVRIANSVTTIKNRAFAGCEDLGKSGIVIMIPWSVEEIGDSAFNDCSRLETINLPINLKKIGKRAFSQCSNLTGIEIPEDVKVIKEGTFFKCNNLSDLTFAPGSSLQRIETKAFYGCSRLADYLELPSGFKSIWKEAFAQSSVKGVTYLSPNASRVYIGVGAFENSNLEDLTFDAPLAVHGHIRIMNSAFDRCGRVRQFIRID